MTKANKNNIGQLETDYHSMKVRTFSDVQEYHFEEEADSKKYEKMKSVGRYFLIRSSRPRDELDR